ncbi:GNAT family N-acetyltransferase [Rhodopila sp.]|uniref:GNAT family N-acetyltransferase n=1 Tax=Rhodopila sp. TaxID=2480087 RepID=UPI003D0E37A9
MTLRVATEADSGLLESIHAAAFPPAEAWSRSMFSLQLALPNVIGLLCGEHAMILLRVAAGEAEILTVAVVPMARRRGVATNLLKEVLFRLTVAAADVIFLEVSVENTAAQALYTRLGFIPTGRRQRYYSDGSDALVLRLDLKVPPKTT